MADPAYFNYPLPFGCTPGCGCDLACANRNAWNDRYATREKREFHVTGECPLPFVFNVSQDGLEYVACRLESVAIRRMVVVERHERRCQQGNRPMRGQDSRNLIRRPRSRDWRKNSFRPVKEPIKPIDPHDRFLNE
jgi:hypothetical protein